MKTILMIILILLSNNIYAQRQNIDVDLLSNIIITKQDELKKRILKDFIIEHVRTSNYATFISVYNLVDILLTQKNKTVMTKDIITQIVFYSITYKISDYYVRNLLNISNLPYDKEKSIKRYGINSLFEPVFDKKDTLARDCKDIGNLIFDVFYSKLCNYDTMKNYGFFQDSYFHRNLHDTCNSNYSIIHNKKYKILIDAFRKDVGEFDKIFKEFVESDSIISTKILSNINEYDKKTITYLMHLFFESIKTYSDYANIEKDLHQNYFIVYLAEIIQRYTIIELSKDEESTNPFKFKIDVEAIILSLEDKFCKFSSLKNNYIGIEPFFSIGLNSGIFIKKNNNFNTTSSKTDDINIIGLASEKIGLKFLFYDFKYTHSFDKNEPFKYRGTNRVWPRKPKPTLINNIYGMIYISGILYNVVDIKSNKNFNYLFTGAGLGMRFYNDLELNISYSLPIIENENFKGMRRKSFINMSFDVPIFTYLKEIKK